METLAEYLARAQVSFLSFGAESKIRDRASWKEMGREEKGGERKQSALKYEKLFPLCERGGRKFSPEITALQREFRLTNNATLFLLTHCRA